MDEATHGQFIQPPELSPILGDNEQLQPTQDQLKAAVQKSREYWHQLVAVALSQHGSGLSPSSTNPQNMLSRVPAMHEKLAHSSEIRYSASSSDVLCTETSSTWAVLGESGCGITEKRQTIAELVQIGTSGSIPCRFEGPNNRWIGTTDENRDGDNYIGVLAMGWAYILSARLVEMQGEGARMRYTSARTRDRHRGPCGGVLDIGVVDENTLRWWEAILSRGQGWEALIARRPGGTYLAPWSISRTDTYKMDLKFTYKHWTSHPETTYGALSSRQAFEVLSYFALIHNLGSQFLIALTTALTFPTHNCHGSSILLPIPPTTSSASDYDHVDPITPEWKAAYDKLPYYMSLSCSPEVVMSSLCGMFWEDGVPCNMVSPWLHPVLNELPAASWVVDTPGLYHDILAAICRFRRPCISALWLGATASGLIPVVLRRLRKGNPLLHVNGYPWTGCPQSFMDIAGSGSYICEGTNDKIQRADVWRLLYLPPVVDDELSYEDFPYAPWAPPGHSTSQNCVLRVACHLHCKRHRLEYLHWQWTLRNGSVVKDQGFNTHPIEGFLEHCTPGIQQRLPIEFPEKPLDQEASRKASKEVFEWAIVNGEDIPPEEVYSDDWIHGEA
ncbi:hypothetical protein A1O3_06064 [Capronia epimyces CBS 606.96]|uniref:Uncharacterized protein n=1 Tax=Capronia epimyces CBS 606.96 TaxID=1182542 RepID=W9XZ51_9EURO|nr:uncharacterized protein A1O3_06064 [Capronia epimyces CBS 606.96]EXJ82251.1 hypothetical protein A1O3_06064 [Capronia epimyces CBS 606.96]